MSSPVMFPACFLIDTILLENKQMVTQSIKACEDTKQQQQQQNPNKIL